MITYEKLKKLNTLILSERLIEKYKYKKKYFTRKRQINSEDVIYFTLNKRGLSLRMEMNKYKEMSGRLENTSKSAICQQRKKIKPEIFKELNQDYIRNSYDNEKDYKRIKGYVVMAIDGMDIEIPDVEELREKYGTSEGREGQRKSARAQASCLYDIVNNWVIDAEIDKYKESERELAKRHIKELVKTLEGEVELEKVIIIFDRGYASVEMMYILQEKGIKYILRGRKKIYGKEIEKMEKEDEEIEIRMNERNLRSVKERRIKEKLRKKGKIKTRIVKNELETGEEEILITNIKEEEFKGEEIVNLYSRRWNIELAYNIAKNKLEIENFSGQNAIVLEQEFYGQMIMMNIAEDLKREGNEGIGKKKEKGYKYDYQVNMNILIGLLRERFILIMLKMAIERDEESQREYYELIEEIRKELVPIRPGRKNERKKYKGYNKYKKNYRRNS